MGPDSDVSLWPTSFENPHETLAFSLSWLGRSLSDFGYMSALRRKDKQNVPIFVGFLLTRSNRVSQARGSRVRFP